MALPRADRDAAPNVNIVRVGSITIPVYSISTAIERHYELRLNRLPTQEREISPLANADGLSRSEALVFLQLWRIYMREWEPPGEGPASRLPHIIGMLWDTLRGGWGAWRPSDIMNDTVIGVFNRIT